MARGAKQGDGTMRLCVFPLHTGHHQAAWRHPQAFDGSLDFAHYKQLVQIAERGKFDAFFLGDGQVVASFNKSALSRSAHFTGAFEPLTLIGGLIAVTERIGFVSTASTSFNYPYQLARKFASLDHMSGGRIGWNIVTSGIAEEAKNFGLDEHYEHELRYERATEFVELCMGLWDSWEDDAFVRDRESGTFLDPDKMHVLGHEGEHFKVKGPLNVPRMPQGYPLFVQAGASPTGQSFAARFAEMVFTGPLDVEMAREQYGRIKELAASHGRDPDHVKVMPALTVLVKKTEEEALEQRDYLQSLVHVDQALAFLSSRFGVDVTQYPTDEPLPEEPPPGASVYYAQWAELGRKESLTLGDLAMRLARQMPGAGVFGSVEQVVDLMEEWFTSGACDGFNIRPVVTPWALEDFVELAIPELRRRGLARSEYVGTTLREHFGLPRPAWRPHRQPATAQVS